MFTKLSQTSLVGNNLSGNTPGGASTDAQKKRSADSQLATPAAPMHVNLRHGLYSTLTKLDFAT